MPNLLDMAKQATEGGMAFACAMCKHYWKNEEVPYELRAQGAGRCSQTTCGGPMGGRTFPSYLGPLPAGDWDVFCFVCGSPETTHGVKLADGSGSRVLGVCRDHVRFVDEQAPESGEVIVEKTVLLLPRAGHGAARHAKRGA